ncbi:GHMP kinase [Sporodiniella umbellata]|nr:GHMP kinase [Sporodiniella umbellata]
MPDALQQKMNKLIERDLSEQQRVAILAFLYLLNAMQVKSSHRIQQGFTICLRSFLPVGAGLGSSASYSVAMSAGLLILNGLIPVEFNTEPEREQYLELINTYAFKAEQVIHGNPSGVDNAVATYGGAKTFVRGKGFDTLEGFGSLRLMLTNTKVPRSTNALVAGVGEKLRKYPQVVEPILDAMNAISVRCQDAFGKLAAHEITEEAVMAELEDLVLLNHSLLNAIGVGHPSLDKVKVITGEFNLKTKLTGAGGGGCAVTFIPKDASQEKIDLATSRLEEEGFDCYQTSVGGVGASAMLLTGNENQEWVLSVCREDIQKYL